MLRNRSLIKFSQTIRTSSLPLPATSARISLPVYAQVARGIRTFNTILASGSSLAWLLASPFLLPHYKNPCQYYPTKPFQHSQGWPISIFQLRPAFLPPSSGTMRHLLPRRQYRFIRFLFRRPNPRKRCRRNSRRMSGRKCAELLQDGRAGR